MFLFSFVSKHFLMYLVISSLTHWFFKYILFNFHIFMDFWIFLLLLISSSIPLWSEKILGMTSVFFSLLRLVLCPNTWPMLKNVPCVIEKNVHSAVAGWILCLISSIGILCHANPQFPYWSSLWLIYSYWKCRIEISFNCIQKLWPCTSPPNLYVINVTNYIFLKFVSMN